MRAKAANGRTRVEFKAQSVNAAAERDRATWSGRGDPPNIIPTWAGLKYFQVFVDKPTLAGLILLGPRRHHQTSSSSSPARAKSDEINPIALFTPVTPSPLLATPPHTQIPASLPPPPRHRHPCSLTQLLCVYVCAHAHASTDMSAEYSSKLGFRTQQYAVSTRRPEENETKFPSHAS